MVRMVIDNPDVLRPGMLADGVGGELDRGNGAGNIVEPDMVCASAGSAEPDAEGVLDVEREVLPQIGRGLLLLWNSARFAKGLAEDAWEFSVEWPELRRAGLTCNEGRWLIHKGLVRQAHEVTSVSDKRRKFAPYASLRLSDKTCLVLTVAGCRFARRVIASRGASAADAKGKLLPTPASHEPDEGPEGDGEARCEAWGRLKPKWDRDRRQLRLSGTIIKEFKVPAANQEVILAVFEEEGWPAKIDDPLPRSPEIDPQRRLHDTINSLNRNQRHRLVHFGTDGLGRGARWWLKPPAGQTPGFSVFR
jgi:hypothetical protein